MNKDGRAVVTDDTWESMPQELDAKERRFVSEYLIDLDPKRAAIEAGYSATVAASKAYQWVSNSKVKPHVYEAIQKAMNSRSKRTEITADNVLRELARSASQTSGRPSNGIRH